MNIIAVDLVLYTSILRAYKVILFLVHMSEIMSQGQTPVVVKFPGSYVFNAKPLESRLYCRKVALTRAMVINDSDTSKKIVHTS